MKYRLPDGHEIEGETFGELVEAMADQKFTEPSSIESYRRATATRVSRMYNVDINSDTDESFVRSLAENELLVKI